MHMDMHFTLIRGDIMKMYSFILLQAIDTVIDTDLNMFLTKAAGGLLTREEYMVGVSIYFAV